MKNLIPLSLIILIFTCCNQKKEEPMYDPNIRLVEQYFELFNQHKWTELAEMYSENAEFKDPTFGPEIVRQSRAEFIQKYSELNAIFPDLKDEVIQIYPSGKDHLVVEFISTGKAADHTELKLPICTIFTIENGLITKDFTYFDNSQEE